ncbi:MAG: hypothetical protein EAZ30_10845 [Betaproteobacteria bacterium]|nr:MAG: hypothetical protein EAZ30_10845 [Betaproteobacteria bacterium]
MSEINVMLCRVALSAALLSTSIAVTGCYVVPVHQDGRSYPAGGVIVSPAPVVAAPLIAPPPASPAVANLRLYPSNDEASRIGVVTGQVVNLLDGRGQFAVTVGAETFTGEATRSPGRSNSGVASAAGSRGGFLTCQYTMSSPTQGVGTCSLSSGAAFRMHLGG